MKSDQEISPPQWPLKFLRWFCHPDLIEDVEGDISELYAARFAEGKLKARSKFIIDVLMLLRPGIVRNLNTGKQLITVDMISNYLKIAKRNALRYKGFTALNLLGLIVGIASSMLVLLWVQDEVAMDKFHVQGDQIYQLFRNMKQSGGMVNTTTTIPKPVSDLMISEYPEVDEVALMGWPTDVRFGKGTVVSKAEGRYVTPEFLKMFSYDLLQGDSETALNDLSSLLITEGLALKVFGEEWRNTAIGASLRVNDEYEAVVTGILKDPGKYSSIKFEWFLPAEAFINKNQWVNDWGNGSFRTYFTTSTEEKSQVIAERLLNEINDHTAENDKAGDEQLIIYKFEDTYLHSNIENGTIDGGRIDYVRIMTVVAFFILVVACINFMNLATARSDRRSKEIGLRKVMGAAKQSIGAQFYFEAFLLTLISVIIALIIVVVTLPFFNQIVDKELVVDFTLSNTWIFLLSVTFTVSFLSGSYPALLLSKFGIIQSLRGSIKQSPMAALLRKGLVVFQFGISTLLIISTAVIYKQIDFMLEKDLGLDKENLIAVSLEGGLSDRLDTYKTELMNLPEVTSVTAASGNPIAYGRSTSSANWTGKNPNEGYEVNLIISDDGFIEGMGMEMLKGRAFSSQLQDSTNFIINEVALELMGFDDPIGKDLSFWGIQGKIIGVVKNFHMRNMHEPIAPLIITCFDPSNTSLALIRLQGNINDGLLGVEEVTQKLNGALDFEYNFLNRAYEESYKSEMAVSKLSNIFSVISIFISCLGLFGLSAYTAERRSREIGVRKVHGASIWQILLLLSKDYSKLMLISFLVAVPFAYHYAQQWLENFEFRTTLSADMFLLAGITIFVLGVFTVSTKSFQAAKVNPIKSLKNE